MNTQAEQDDDVTNDETAVIEDEATEQPQAQAEGEQAQAKDDEAESDEVVVSIGEEAPPPEPAPAPEWIRELRKTNRELQRQNRELQAKLQSTAQTETKPVALGPKPRLEDHDYDADKFEAAFATWVERKRQADEAKAKQEAEALAQDKAWQATLDGYGKAKAELRVRIKDFGDAEAVAEELFSDKQQYIMIHGADSPALVVYALGKNPKKAQELAAIKDPVKFSFAVAKLEKDLKVTNRKAAPPPERIVSGTGRVSGAVDSTLERLREEAARTGNMTKVMQYKAQKRSASK
jgi:hypothetical protein